MFRRSEVKTFLVYFFDNLRFTSVFEENEFIFWNEQNSFVPINLGPGNNCSIISTFGQDGQFREFGTTKLKINKKVFEAFIKILGLLNLNKKKNTFLRDRNIY